MRSCYIAVLVLLSLVAFADCAGDSKPPASQTAPATSSMMIATPTATAAPVPPAEASVEPTAKFAEARKQACVRDRHPSVMGFDLNATTSWIVCQGGGGGMIMPKTIYRTFDGGETWTLISKRDFGEQTPLAGVGVAPSGVATLLYFQDRSNGWMGTGGAGPAVHRTRDGGVTWNAVTDLSKDSAVKSVSFSSALEGIIVMARGTAETTTWVTSDGGDHWTKAP